MCLHSVFMFISDLECPLYLAAVHEEGHVCETVPVVGVGASLKDLGKYFDDFWLKVFLLITSVTRLSTACWVWGTHWRMMARIWPILKQAGKCQHQISLCKVGVYSAE